MWLAASAVWLAAVLAPLIAMAWLCLRTAFARPRGRGQAAGGVMGGSRRRREAASWRRD